MQISWPETKFTKLAKIRLPILQAPMAGGATTVELVAAVSHSGGLGFLAAGYMNANEIRTKIRQIRQLTDKPFGINLFIPERHYASNKDIEKSRKAIQQACYELNMEIPFVNPPYTCSFEEQIAVILEEKIPAFSFTFGIPSMRWIEDLKKNKTLIIGTATSIEEAIKLEHHSVDVIVAQGSEAGGHRGTFLGKAEENLISVSLLVPQICQRVKIPVIAAGGMMNATEIYAAMTLGASAVQMGTAFLSCHESGIHPLYKKLLLEAKKDTTTLTRAFSGKLARGLINQFIIRMQVQEDTIVEYPIQNALTNEMRKKAYKENVTDFMSLWAGQGVHLSKQLSAAQLIHELNEGMLALCKNGIK